MAHAMNPQSDGGAIPQLTIARRLLLARLEVKLSQRDMAKLIGKTERTIGRYETGEGDVPLSVVLAYAMVTGMNREWLEKGTIGDMPVTGVPRSRWAA